MSKREFELDLTSVCVGSGVVQLPLKMQALFVAGGVPAIVDGEELLLSFIEPRRLSGFKEHFERRGLRSNDKLRFEVEVAGEKSVALVAASIKRERSKPAQQRTTFEQGAPGTTADAAGTEQLSRSQVSSAWGASDNGRQVRAVRKVRVEGGAPLPVSPAAQRFGQQTPGEDARRPGDRVTGRGAKDYSGWAPLDGLSSEGDQQLLAQGDYPEATVREVRRSRIGADRDQEAQTDPEVAWAVAGNGQAVPPLFAHGVEVVEPRAHAGPEPARRAAWAAQPVEGREASTARAVDAGPDIVEQVSIQPVPAMVEVLVTAASAAAPLQQLVGETASLRVPQAPHLPAPRIPVPRNTAAGSTWQPTAASGFNNSEPSGVVRQPRLIEETDLTPLREAVAPPMARSAESQRGAPAESSSAAFSTAPVRAKWTAPRAIDDAEFGGEYLHSGRSLETALLHESDEVARPDARTTAADERGNPGAEQPTASFPDAGHMPAQPREEPVRVQQHAKPARLEDDLRLIEAYLDRPSTPAIVRSEVIAIELGMDDQRSERALERLSENRDRVSRIRKGAYMVKKSATGRSTGL